MHAIYSLLIVCCACTQKDKSAFAHSLFQVIRLTASPLVPNANRPEFFAYRILWYLSRKLVLPDRLLRHRLFANPDGSDAIAHALKVSGKEGEGPCGPQQSVPASRPDGQLFTRFGSDRRTRPLRRRRTAFQYFWAIAKRTYPTWGMSSWSGWCFGCGNAFLGKR